MQLSLDPKTGSPAPEARSSDTEKAPAETPAPAQRSDLERELQATIESSTAVQWLREHPVVYQVSAVGATLLVAVLLYVVLRAIVFVPLLRFLKRRADGAATGGALVVRAIRESGIANPLAWVLPCLVAWRGIGLWPGLMSIVVEVFGRGMLCAGIAFGLVSFARVLQAIDILMSLRLKRPGAMRGYVQAISAVVYAVGGISIIAIFLGRSPIFFLTGVGAFAAVLAVVLKDTLLSMYANILMTTGDTLRVGDWIEMKQYGLDGRVETISLTSTKVRNWDETTLSVPNYRFVSEVFVNYRTNDPAGGRRLRRTVRLDQRTVRLLRTDELDVAARVPELAAAVNSARAACAISSTELTNLGLYRTYVEQYLASHPKTDRARPVVVRQNEPTPSGVPLDVLAFFHDSDLKSYEALQATVLDHLVGASAVFGLRVYQTGSDLGVVREPLPFLASDDLQRLRPA
ncbi:MAG: mechanosensitive ion channel family protein [Phycisphaerales bacterium]